MPEIPRDPSPESSLALLREGNTFISTRCERYDSDLFKARLLLQDTLCLRGEAAARLFYDETCFTREDAAPRMLLKTLFGEGGVQGLDGEAHRVRKHMFMALMTDEGIAELEHLAEECWQEAIEAWKNDNSVILFHEVQEIHFRAVCRWAGIPLDENEIERRCSDITTMIDGAGGIGMRHWKARQSRKRAEKWIRDLVEQVRTSTLKIDEKRALFQVSWHCDADGSLLEPQTAAVEILNLVRPTVAIARYVTFAALALHENQRWRDTLQSSSELIDPFVQEVRRVYTFFPFVAARTRKDFVWNDYHFPKGNRVLLDLYGTNHDPRSWESPRVFDPERFQGDTVNAYNFIPQGGGEHATNHRCPGEWFAVSLMTLAVKQLIHQITYEVPQQDLSIDWSRMPIRPASGFIISQIKTG